MQTHDFNRTRLIIGNADKLLKNNHLMLNEFCLELLDPERVKLAVRKFMRAIESAKKPLYVFEAECAVGYTRSDFVSHIQRQFTCDMSWDNRGEWHIDHIIPVSKFIKSNDLDIRKINCLSNLRPIMARDNLIKGDRLVSLV